MAKRFVDSDLYNQKWYRILNPKMKCAWIYLMTNCDHAGIIDPDLDLMSFMIGSKISEKEIIDAFGDQIRSINGSKWFLIKFIPFQYGELRETNNAHKSVLKRLKKYDIDLGADEHLIRCLPASQDKDKDKVKVKVKKDVSLKSIDQKFIDDLQSNNMDVDVKTEFEKFKDYLESKGKTYKNYRSAFRNWIRSPFVEKTDRIRKRMQIEKDQQKRIKEQQIQKKMEDQGEFEMPEDIRDLFRNFKKKGKIIGNKKSSAGKV